MTGQHLVAASGFALAAALVYFARELGKTRASIDRVTQSPALSALLRISA
jgi:hypothetical protein